MNLSNLITLRIRDMVASGSLPFNNHATLSNGLVSYWKLDEKSGTRVDSVTATGNDLTDNNTVTYVNSAPNGVVATFTSANNESLSNAYTWAAGTSYTFAAWIKVTATGIGSAAHCEFIGGGGGGNFSFRAFTDTTLQLITSGFGVTNQVTVASLSDKWHFVVGYYQDGVGSGISFDGGSYQTAVDVANGATTITCIGDRSTSPTSPMDGNIVSVGMWSGVLAASEVQSLYNNGVGKYYSSLTAAEKVGLVSYWNLDEVSGTRADSFGTNTLTDNNTVTSVTNAVPPPKNIAAQFLLTNSERLNHNSVSFGSWNTTGISYSLWYKVTGDQFYLFSRDDNVVREGVLGRSSGAATWTLFGIATLAGNADSGDGNWTHVILTFDPADGKMRVYTNGDSGTTSVAGTPTAGSTSVEIGGRVISGQYVTGNIDEVGVWRRVLTSQERTDLYNSGAGLYY